MCASGCDEKVTPAPSQLARWTTELRDAQPEDSFFAVYARRDRKFVQVAAKHSTDTNSLTFKLIQEAYDAFVIETVIIEGIAYSLGPDPRRVMDYVAEHEQRAENGFQPGGETVPAVIGARSEGATVWGGEPSDPDILAIATAQGLRRDDLLGFYTLRSVPQWIRERKIDGAGDPRARQLIESELEKNRSRLELGSEVLPGYAEWEVWYASTNGKPFGDDFKPEETGPLVDGPYATNKIAAAISVARDSFLLERVADHLNRGETVMVVYGASHLMIMRPALDVMLGQPCYVGTKFDAAKGKCPG